MKTKILTTAILFSFSLILNGQIIHVPEDQPTIQAGINAVVNGDTVLVDQGTYFENINFLGKAITVSSHYLFEKDSAHIYNTIIDGSQPMDPDSASVVYFISGEDSTSVLNGFTITGGTGTEFPVQPPFVGIRAGGGIAIESSGAKICHNIIINNMVENEEEAFGGGIGGGLCMEEKWVVIENNLITNNSAVSNLWPKGGGMAVAYCNTRICNNTVIHNIVSANSSTMIAAAGGIWYSCDIGFPDSVIVSGNIIQYNLVEQLSINYNGTAGGGLSIVGNAGQTVSALITNNVISDNVINAVSGAYGCGAFMSNCKSVDFSNNSIFNNTFIADHCRGGGLCIWNNHPLVSRNLIYDNHATQGGGIYVGYQIASMPQIINNTIYGNTADNGGGLYLKGSQADIRNTIVWGNTANLLPGIYQEAGTNNTVNYSLVQGWTGAGIGNLDEDPLFDDPYNDDFHLTWANFPEPDITKSPCIDTGDPSFPSNPDNTVCDIGACYFDQRPIYALDATEITESSFIANWEEAQDAMGYLLDVAYDDGFTDFVVHNLDVGNVLSFSIEDLNPLSIYYYRVRANYYFGRSGYSNPIVVATLTSINEQIGLSEIIKVYPNPFTHQTTIQFTVPDAGFVSLIICDITGKKIQTLHSGPLQTGEHSFVWDAEGFKGGLYFLRLEMDGDTESRKLLLIK
ncbi:MAG: right-handed parallel beta-helix repeat-containing protein [Mariniphaga sp.]|nr:right-handed parallel beta-helix repeat-containing protein [Mariniphaga sp.]